LGRDCPASTYLDILKGTNLYKMTFRETIDYLKDLEGNAPSLFERLIIIILERFFLENGKRIFVEYKVEGIEDRLDIFIPSGIDSNKPSVIEIKYLTSKKFLLINQIILDYAKKTFPIHTTNTFLLVLPIYLDKNDFTTKINPFIKGKYPDFNLEIWDVNKIQPLFDTYVEYVSNVIPQLRPRAIKSIVDKSLHPKEWEKERKDLLVKIKQAYVNDDLVLFTGAGVSASAGLPQWDALLSQLLVSMISNNLPSDSRVTDEEKVVLAEVLKKVNLSSPLLEARYVNSGIGDTFESEVASILYNKVTDETSSPLLKAIANLSAPSRGKVGLAAIVTYNFDDLFEKELVKVKVKHRSIFRDSDLPEKHELGIFHVHGFLPRNDRSYLGIKESVLVFSEKNYHAVMKDPYFWSNIVQLNFFRENTCVLVGFSGSDPNLRRLLEIAKIKTKFSKHFILLKRSTSEEFEIEYKKHYSNYDPNLLTSINTIHHRLLEQSFDELGLNVIWYQTYEEIPDVLNLIKE
jgi:hypothetical protein